VQSGAPRDVYRRPATRFVAEFVGSSNVIEGECPADGSPRLILGNGLMLNVERLPPGARSGRRMVASVRPETIEIVENALEDGRPNTFPGRIRRIAFTGPVVECTVEAGSLSLEVHAPATAASGHLAEGRTVTLRVQPADVFVIPQDDA
jgi:ABC-type Fe3+/spermidine/putrescine transport system ATPase subunit